MNKKYLALAVSALLAAAPPVLCFGQETRSQRDKATDVQVPRVVEIYTVKNLELYTTVDLIHSLSKKIRVGAEEATSSLVLSGPEDDVGAILKVLEHLDSIVPPRAERHEEQEEPEPPQSLAISFFFVQGSFHPDEPPSERPVPLPESITPVAEVLAENGFHHLSLLAPLLVRVREGSEFETAGSVAVVDGPDVEEQFDIFVQGVAHIGSLPEISMKIDAEIKYHSRAALGGGGFSRSSGRLFNLATTVIMKVGDYVVLSASPASTTTSTGVAMIVRVEVGD